MAAMATLGNGEWLKLLLKRLGRSYGFSCLEVMPEPDKTPG
jgi:hypothetical protein